MCECIFEITFCFEAQAALESTTSYLSDQSARITGKRYGAPALWFYNWYLIVRFNSPH